MGDLNARLVKALARMENPKKDSKAEIATKNGGKFSYTYATLDQVLAIVKKALGAEGLALMQSVNKVTGIQGVYEIETAVFSDTEWRTLDIRPYRIVDDIRGQGSLETYTRRYALLMVFGLAGEDDDGADASQAPVSASAPLESKPTAPKAFPEFSALKQRLVAAGMDATAAGNLLKKELGDPRSMDEEQYRSAIANGDVLVRSYEHVNQ